MNIITVGNEYTVSVEQTDTDEILICLNYQDELEALQFITVGQAIELANAILHATSLVKDIK